MENDKDLQSLAGDLPDGSNNDTELEKATKLAKFLLMAPAGSEEYVFKYIENHSENKREQLSQREQRFFSTFECELIRKIFPWAKLTPGLKETSYFIGMIDCASEVIFPFLRKKADPDATFSEAAGLDPEHVKTQPLLLLQEMLWHELYFNDFPAPAIEAPELERISIKRPDNVQYPLDKLNSNIWNLPEDVDKATFTMEAKRGSRSTRKPLECIYSINFNGLEQEGLKITRRLTPFDKRVYIAVSALYNMGYRKMTLRQIFYAMGQKASNPKGTQLKQIYESLTKMSCSRIFIDNSQEQKLYHYDLTEGNRGVYDWSLLEFDRAAVVSRGKITNAAIHLNREPSMSAFAKMRNQITTIDIKLLQSPVSKTDANLAIEDYLIIRLARAKNAAKDFEKIRFKTLFEKTGISEKNQVKRAPGKIEKYMQFYREENWITDYVITRDSVTAYFKGPAPSGADPADKQTDDEAEEE